MPFSGIQSTDDPTDRRRKRSGGAPKVMAVCLGVLLAAWGSAAMFSQTKCNSQRPNQAGQEQLVLQDTEESRRLAESLPPASQAQEPNDSPVPVAEEDRTSESHADSPLDSSLPSESLLDALQSGVVKIETAGLGRPKTLGSGVVLHVDGLIATNYHVIAEATQARVRFAEGSDFEVLGYLAVSPEDDLAILQTVGLPVTAAPLTLWTDDEPGVLAPVFSIGHPHGIDFSPYDGRVSRVLSTSDLPDHAQVFLEALLGGQFDHRWIQHTAHISTGNSGGPLLDRQGNVIGINTWVDGSTRFDYAIPASNLARLLEQVGSTVEPLELYARPQAQLSVLLSRLTGDYLLSLFEEANSWDWQPQTDRQYDVLRQLSWCLTFAYSPESFAHQEELTRERLDAIAFAADAILASLKAQPPLSQAEASLLNGFASVHLGRDPLGIVLIAQVERLVSGHGQQGALLRLEGFDREVFLPLDGMLIRPKEADRLLLLGVDQAESIHYGENPLALREAAMVISHAWIPLPEPRE